MSGVTVRVASALWRRTEPLPRPYNFTLRPKWFNPFIDPAEIVARARGLDRQTLTDRQGEMIDALVQEYEREQQRAKEEDPFEDFR